MEAPWTAYLQHTGGARSCQPACTRRDSSEGAGQPRAPGGMRAHSSWLTEDSKVAVKSSAARRRGWKAMTFWGCSSSVWGTHREWRAAGGRRPRSHREHRGGDQDENPSSRIFRTW